MQLLSLNFLIYTFCGIWRPIEWTSSVAKSLYNAFSFCVVFSLHFFMLSQFMDIVLVVDNMDDFITDTLMFVTILTDCCKTVIAVKRRSTIIDLVETLLKEPCKPRDEDEIAIQFKFDQFIAACSIKYTLLATSSVTGLIVKSMLNVIQGHLPYRAWLPYDPNVSPTFWIVSAQQIVSLLLGNYISVGTETLVFGFFLQTCAQLEIFESRLHKLVLHKITQHTGLFCASPSKEEIAISAHVRHHLKIYKYAKAVNSIFNEVLFVQFFGSIIVLCTCIYYLSTHISDSEAATLIVFTICMTTQIFLYCWSGNEVILKSASIGNVIYHMDWPSLPISDRRNLLMIMKRSAVPIKFTSSFLITLSLESFSNILKTSYSAFNVLQQS